MERLLSRDRQRSPPLARRLQSNCSIIPSRRESSNQTALKTLSTETSYSVSQNPAQNDSNQRVIRSSNIESLLSKLENELAGLKYEELQRTFSAIKSIITGETSVLDPDAEVTNENEVINADDIKSNINECLIWAASNGKLSVIKYLLLNPRANLSYNEFAAVKAAAESEHDSVVGYLLDLIVRKNQYNLTFCDNFALKWAITKGDTRIVNLLLSSDVDPSFEDNWAIRTATEKGFHEIAELLCNDSRVDPTARSNVTLINASANGHSEIVRLLLDDSRVDPSTFNNVAIRMASNIGHAVVVEQLLLDPRVDPSVDDNFALRKAAENGHKNIVKMLLLDPRVEASGNDIK